MLTLQVLHFVGVVAGIEICLGLEARLVDGRPVEGSRSLLLCVVVPQRSGLSTSRYLRRPSEITDAARHCVTTTTMLPSPHRSPQADQKARRSPGCPGWQPQSEWASTQEHKRQASAIATVPAGPPCAESNMKGSDAVIAGEIGDHLCSPLARGTKECHAPVQAALPHGIHNPASTALSRLLYCSRYANITISEGLAGTRSS